MSGGPTGGGGYILPSSPITDSPLSYTFRRSSNGPDNDGPGDTHGATSSSPRHSPTLPRSFDADDARERQRTMDVDMAIHLSRARRETISMSPDFSPLRHRSTRAAEVQDDFEPEERHRIDDDDEDKIHVPHTVLTDDEDNTLPSPTPSRIDLATLHHLNHGHDPTLLASSLPRGNPSPGNAPQAPLPEGMPLAPNNESLYALPTYQAADTSRTNFDFSHMEQFASVEKTALGLSPTTKFALDTLLRPVAAQPKVGEPSSEAGPSTSALVQQNEPSSSKQSISGANQDSDRAEGDSSPRPSSSTIRHRKLSQSHPHPRLHRKGIGGKIGLFETPHVSAPGFMSSPSGGGPSLSAKLGLGGLNIGRTQQDAPSGFDPLSPGHQTVSPGSGIPGGILTTGHDRPYRFSFYSNALAATIHARSLSELPAEGQSFEDLFAGVQPPPSNANTPAARPVSNGASTLVSGVGPSGVIYSRSASPGDVNGYFTNQPNLQQQIPAKRAVGDQKLMLGPGSAEPDEKTWWLDVLSPTDEEMKMLSKVGTNNVVWCMKVDIFDRFSLSTL
jgi:magnesium transporter